VLSFAFGLVDHVRTRLQSDDGTAKRRGCPNDVMGILISERGDGVGRFSPSP
jgi:hypothetical protein